MNKTHHSLQLKMMERGDLMKRSIYLLFSAIFYIAGWILIGYLLMLFPKTIQGYIYIDMITIIKSGSIILLFLLVGTIFAMAALDKESHMKSKVIKFFMVSITIIYVLSFFNIVFFTNHSLSIKLDLIPFSNIFLLVYEFLSDGPNAKDSIIYLLYNIFIYIPMGLLLYYFSEKFRKFNMYFITMLLIITISTMVQYFIGVNSLRIDDILLSLFGSIFTFLSVEKIYLYYKEEKNEKSKI